LPSESKGHRLDQESDCRDPLGEFATFRTCPYCGIGQPTYDDRMFAVQNKENAVKHTEDGNLLSLMPAAFEIME